MDKESDAVEVFFDNFSSISGTAGGQSAPESQGIIIMTKIIIILHVHVTVTLCHASRLVQTPYLTP